MAIDYELYSEMSLWIKEKYPNRVYFEPPSYKSDKGEKFQNIGIKLADFGQSTLALVCEYDKGEKGSERGVYVGVKCIKCPSERVLKDEVKKLFFLGNGYCSKPQKGANGKCFSWLYYEKISDIDAGKKIYKSLKNKWDSYLMDKIFEKQ